jgi:hypothetical protein
MTTMRTTTMLMTTRGLITNGRRLNRRRGGTSAPSAGLTDRRIGTRRWRRAGWVLAVAIGFAWFSGPSQAQPSETLTLQGLAPQLTFDDNSGTPQIWDLFGDHTGFDIVNTTSATTPFSIFPAAPNSSFVIGTGGNIGLGTALPSTQLHVYKLAQSSVAESIARFEISDDSIGRLEINNVSAGNGIFHPRLRGTTASQAVALTMEGVITTDAGTNPVVAYDAARRTGGVNAPVVTRPLVVYRNNTVIKAKVAANGDMFATSFSPISSRTLKDRIVDLDSGKASEALRQLTPVEFV